jgi:hypothetical protein
MPTRRTPDGGTDTGRYPPKSEMRCWSAIWVRSLDRPFLEKMRLIIHGAMQYADNCDPVACNLVEDQIIAVHTAANAPFVTAGKEGKSLRRFAEGLATLPQFGNETYRAAGQIARDFVADPF